jgi:hydrogenase small subunit
MPKEIPLVWISGASCTGCSISLLNTASPTIKNVLIDEVIPGVHINLRYHQAIMAGAGDQAIEVLENTAREFKGGFVLAIEGAVPYGETAAYCVIGERDGKPVTMQTWVEELGKDALAVLSIGTCASFGGLPAGAPNPSNCISAVEVLKAKGITTPVVNIPGCPPHPDWIIGTIASILLNGLPTADDLDDNLRPKAFYGKLIHENCPRRAYFDEGKFAKKFGEEGCLYELGCKGPITYADCPLRRWNSGTNWVIGVGAPCNGCTQPEFIDGTSPFYEKLEDVELPVIGACWLSGKEDN